MADDEITIHPDGTISAILDPEYDADYVAYLREIGRPDLIVGGPVDESDRILAVRRALTTGVYGGPGSGPRPGHRSPWYERGSKTKVQAGLDDIMAAGKTGNATILNDAINSVYRDFESSAGYRVESFNSKYSEGYVGPETGRQVPGTLQVELEVMDGKKSVGYIRRFYHDDEPNVAKHDYLVLQPEARGRGFATEFNRFNDEWYAKNGVDTIKLEAALDDGKITWAKAGYDWDRGEWGDNLVRRDRRAYLDDLAGRVRDPKLAERLRGDFDQPDYPTPYEVVTSPGGDTALSSGLSWFGSRYLNPLAGVAITAAATWAERFEQLDAIYRDWDHEGEEAAMLRPEA